MGIIGGIMVYRNYHEECKFDCTRLVAYVRIDGRFTKIGHYGSECKQFEPLDIQKEEQDIQAKERRVELGAKIRQVKQESRERRKIIENELNVVNSFYKEQLSNQNDTSCKND